ncbi:hypothetical protein QAD02_015422 [Eretmocerus hayati]|uniref:Uncharacterized protein n=1 Tax=Eretmocerus hayati TaxID=131215 RepID=A0ACC2PCZ0_9HYME|nr:hypothetical protein QAD02_015422 [Eretmocerus hayati]
MSDRSDWTDPSPVPTHHDRYAKHHPQSQKNQSTSAQALNKKLVIIIEKTTSSNEKTEEQRPLFTPDDNDFVAEVDIAQDSDFVHECGVPLWIEVVWLLVLCIILPFLFYWFVIDFVHWQLDQGWTPPVRAILRRRESA